MPITVIGGVTDCTQFLKNRFKTAQVKYLDTGGNTVFTNLLIQTNSGQSKGSYFGKQYMYSPMYRPYYIKFRYIVRNDTNNGWIEGIPSETIAITHSIHPFLVDETASLSLGRKCGSINPLLVVSQMRAQFVQKQK